MIKTMPKCRRIIRKHKCELAECLITVIENLLNVIKSGYILNTNERVTLNDFFIFYKTWLLSLRWGRQ